MAYSINSKDHFNTVTYTGNSTDNRAITGVGFQPDWTWIKLRNAASQHELFDAVRGANKPISSNLTTAESTTTNNLKSFDSDGFTLGTATAVNGNYNFAAWNWKAGNSSGSANTDGAVSSTVSVNTSAGFSIVSYAGSLSSAGSTTIGHGLGVAPKLIIAKSRTAGENWAVYHEGLATNNILQFNTTSAQIDTTSEGAFSAPTSSVFSTNYRGEWNNTGQNYIAYCFAEITGFSKFGLYGANGSSNLFIQCGFKPALVIIKKRSGADNWIMFDNKRDTFNVAGKYLHPNTNSAEASGTYMDFVSNGFNLKTHDGWINNASHNYVYMAWAEAPSVGTNNIPATAR